MKFTIKVSKKYEFELLGLALIAWACFVGWALRAVYLLFSPQGNFNSMLLSMMLIMIWVFIAIVIPVRRFAE